MNKTEMVESNLGLVHSCANRFKNHGVEYEDLFQAGCVGLLKAIAGFDESFGCAFSTYAVPAILGEIKRIFRDGGSIKISRSMKEKSKTMRDEKEKLANLLGREPTVSELSQYTGTSVYEVSELLLASQPVLSLTDGDSDAEFDIPDNRTQSELDEKICLNDCLTQLSEKDRKIIDLRYYKAKTQSDVAAILGMTQVQVSRREKKILTQIREKMSV